MAVALGLMRYTRLRERSIAATDLWDGVLRAQAEATALGKPAKQALEEQNALVQRALDQAWIFVPQ
jgi:hypothetical protein